MSEFETFVFLSFSESKTKLVKIFNDFDSPYFSLKMNIDVNDVGKEYCHMHIYCDSDLKENDYHIDIKNGEQPIKTTIKDIEYIKTLRNEENTLRKIILSTDPQLNKDGIPLISDEYIFKYMEELNILNSKILEFGTKEFNDMCLKFFNGH
jgi:hypothetical protein